MIHTSTSSVLALLPVGLLLLGLGRAHLGVAGPLEREAQDAPRESDARITITAEGRARVAPTLVGIRAVVQTSAATASAALKDHVQARSRALDGMRAAGVEVVLSVADGLVVEPEPANPNQGFNDFIIVNGEMVQGGDKKDTKFRCRQRVVYYLAPLEDPAALAELASLAQDTAKELGLVLSDSVDPFGFVSHLSTVETLTVLAFDLAAEQRTGALVAAEQNAFAEARTRAERLASLGGRAVGKVVSIESAPSSTTWTGIGAEVEVATTVTVAFELVR